MKKDFIYIYIFSEVKTPEEKEKEEQELLNKYYEEYKTKLYEDDDSGKGKSAIPRFYFKVCFNALFPGSHKVFQLKEELVRSNFQVTLQFLKIYYECVLEPPRLAPPLNPPLGKFQ